MIDPNAMSDDRFLAAFLDSAMPASGFDHRGHVRAAWLLLRRHPLEEAVDVTCDGIARLAARLGVPGKYNRTLSEALVRLMAQGGAADRALSWDGFVQANAPLMDDARGLLARHYSPERLAAPAARERFLTPDRLPLPA
ncbi:MAG TPA: hypothetical protein VFF03_09665 [Rhodocyclaceae bacterium]|nr:hypothetical protein [Rhodocyclaceae bacterium]